MIILEDAQGSDGWMQSRIGKPSASNFDKLITATCNPSSSAENYINRIISERLSGEPTEFYVNDAMTRGNDLEPQARAFFEFETGIDVHQTGFILDDSKEFGCSPDGVILEKGKVVSGLEIKCPLGAAAVGNLRRNLMPKKYYQQVQGCMWICDVETWWFMSYHPKMKAMIVEIKRDNEFIKKLEGAVNLAVDIIKLETKRLKR